MLHHSILALFFRVALLASAALAAESGPSLSDVPVAGTAVVAREEYSAATALAARGGAPVAIALEIAGGFEGFVQHIVQVNDRAEGPSACRVTVLRDGFLDDSLRGDRWDITLARRAAGAWSIVEAKRGWRCRRGENTDRFVATPCP